VIQLQNMIGFIPVNLSLYKQAFLHSSISNSSMVNNERLEYLGDAILDSVISEILFKRFPKRSEGFLTETREKLGQIARNMGIEDFLTYNNLILTGSSSILGNALEALIGSIYLDVGYKKTKRFIIYKVIKPHVDLDTLVATESNFKSRMVEWSQKNNAEVNYEIIDEKDFKSYRIFKVQLKINNKIVSVGEGRNKKSAENEASRQGLEYLERIDPKSESHKSKRFRQHNRCNRG